MPNQMNKQALMASMMRNNQDMGQTATGMPADMPPQIQQPAMPQSAGMSPQMQAAAQGMPPMPGGPGMAPPPPAPPAMPGMPQMPPQMPQGGMGGQGGGAY